MKKLLAAAITLATLLVATQTGCRAILEPDLKAVADDALGILRSLRGSTAGVYEPGDQYETFLLDGIDSSFVDELERGVHTLGWLYLDDGDTPEDPADDIVSFRGTREYLDWEVMHRVWLSVHVHEADRATEMAVSNVTAGDSSWYSLDRVNRPGGIQTGPALWTNGQETVEMTMGVHHNETPDDWNDNYSHLEFELCDANDADLPFFVHTDFRPDHSGSGEIRQHGSDGRLVATFEWDDFGRGSLVVNGDIYPFRWD